MVKSIYSILKPEKIRYNALPRKLKKKLKNRLVKTIDGAWKPCEIRIQAVLIDRWGVITTSRPDYRKYFITDYSLG